MRPFCSEILEMHVSATDLHDIGKDGADQAAPYHDKTVRTGSSYSAQHAVMIDGRRGEESLAVMQTPWH